MFGLGFTEIIVILIVVLVAFGPKHLPAAARSLGRALAEFRRSVDEVTRELNTPTIARSETRTSAPTAEQTSAAEPSTDKPALVSSDTGTEQKTQDKTGGQKI